MSDAIERIREALAAAVRPGEWRVSKHREGRDALIYDADGFEVARVCYPNRDANARLIAACNPTAIRELLAERDALKVDAERMDFMEINGLGCDKLGSLGYFVYHNGIKYHGTTARAAIDAAIRREA